ncbi:hypothetical protein, partial [uncultured Demequina sp.]|uniref:hypothetical protein n=1 Tax=uncultured Demequina sp. TaxID=693499 RepID=UPI0025CED41C
MDRKPRNIEARSSADCGATSLGETSGLKPSWSSAASADSCSSVARAGRPTIDCFSRSASAGA